MKQRYLSFPIHIMFHPFDGYWDMKYDNKGKVRVGLAILFLFIISEIIQKQFAGFLVNFNDPLRLNSLFDIATYVVPFLLWCVANWSITTLMEGEGKFREIVMATSYAMVPLVLVYIPMTIASRFMAEEETAFFYLVLSIAGIWFVGLLFIGIMTVHQYTPLKTVITMLLTIVVMGIIVFLGALILSMLQQIAEFIMNVYRELIFRT